MSKAAELAKRFYLEEGYNCSESVWLAMNQDLDEDKLNFGLKLAGAFGGGLSSGCLCGGIGGAALSIARWFGREQGEESHPQFTVLLKALIEFSKERFKGTDCCDLKPEGDHKPECAVMLEELVEFTEKLLDEGPPGADDDECG